MNYKEALQLLDKNWYESFKRAEIAFKAKTTSTKTRVVKTTPNQ